MNLKKFLLAFCALILSVQMVSAQNTFESRYSAAESQYSKKQYQTAITTLKNAKKAMGVTADQRSKADNLISRCEEALRIMNRLLLDIHDIKVTCEGSLDTVHVVAGQAWKATIEANDWCSIHTMGGDILVLNTQPNKTKEPRTAQVHIKMGKQTDIVHVNQEARPDTRRMVRVETDPEYAQVWLEGQSGYRYDTPWTFELGSGRQTIKMSKDGYADRDTTFYIEDDLSKEPITMNFRLRRRFGRISVQVEPEPGFRFTSAPVIELNHAPVAMTGRRNRYESSAPIEYFKLYEDETIPVYPGRTSVTVKADHFKTFDREYSIYENMDTVIHVVMQARTGLLNINDMGNAREADVFIDDEPAGSVPVTGLRVSAGNHVLTIRKDGFVSDATLYDLRIPENRDTTVFVSMTRFGQYHFSSTPSGAGVYIDGDYIGETPFDYNMLSGKHQVLLRRNGYADRVTTMETEFGDVVHEKHFQLQQTYPLYITCDIDSLSVVVSQGDETFVSGVKTPASVHLPFSRKNYRLELFSASQRKPVYRGPLPFRKEGKTTHKVLTFSRANFQPLVADLQFHTPTAEGYHQFGELRLLNFKIFQGLSTSFLKVSAFRGAEPVEEMRNSQWIPAFTCLFLNYDFRMGGRILENLDVCALGEAAWYPHYLSEIKLPLSFMSGLEWFAGGELTSRLPGFNLHVKAGYQNYLTPQVIAPTLWASPREGGDFVQKSVPFPGALVFSIGVSLGGNDSKGENMIRLF